MIELLAGSQVADRGALPSEENPSAWLAARAESLASRATPVVPPPSRPARRLSPRLVGALLALAVLTAAAFELRRDLQRADDLEARVHAIEESRGRTAHARAESLQRGRELVTLADANRTLAAKLSRVESEWELQRARPLALLSALGKCRPPGVVVTRLSPGLRGSIDLAGLGIQVEAIDRLAVDLAATLADVGLQIAPARTVVHELTRGRRCFEFTIEASLGAPGAAP